MKPLVHDFGAILDPNHNSRWESSVLDGFGNAGWIHMCFVNIQEKDLYVTKVICTYLFEKASSHTIILYLKNTIKAIEDR
jgi:hypothetical protein